ncbi:MAG: Burkholderia phage Bp-AMP1 [Pseudomonadota bacterium]|jgi:hypothetical protein
MTATIAQQRKQTGQQLALLKTGPEWTQQAMDYLRMFVCDRMDDGCELFTFEQFRIYAEQAGLPVPLSINAWGAFTRTAAASGLCFPTDTYIKATRPESHARAIRVWKIL